MRRALTLLFKSLGLLLLVGAAWLAFAGWCLHLDGSQQPPSGFMCTGAQRLLSATQKAGGRDLYANRCVAVEDDIRRARFELNLQLAGLWSTRDFSRPEKLMDEAQRDASRLWRDLLRHRALTKTQAASAIETARADLDQAKAITAVSAQEAYIHAKLTAAAIGLKRAETYQAGGRYDQALADAQDSIRNSELAHRRSRLSIARYDDPKHLQEWKAWIRQAVDGSRGGACSFVVVKEQHALQVYKGGRLVRTVHVDLGANAINQKLHAGDRTTPEGLYRITQKKGHGQSKYGMALLLNYPNADDLRRFNAAKQRGELTSRTRIGGLIEIHGEGGRGVDWTDGCIAPDNRDMEALFREASVGTMVAIVGSDGGDGPVRSALRLMVRRG